jgi:hypothetical protein
MLGGISQKALETLPDDGNVMPKHVGAMFYSNPTECTIFYVLENFISSTCFGRHSIHRQEHNCSVQP